MNIRLTARQVIRAKYLIIALFCILHFILPQIGFFRQSIYVSVGMLLLMMVFSFYENHFATPSLNRLEHLRAINIPEKHLRKVLMFLDIIGYITIGWVVLYVIPHLLERLF